MMDSDVLDERLTTKEDLSIAVGVIGATFGIISYLPANPIYKLTTQTAVLGILLVGLIVLRQKRLRDKYSKKFTIKKGSIGGVNTANLLKEAENHIKVTHFTLRRPNQNYQEAMNSLVSNGVQINRVVHFRQKEEVTNSPDDYEWIRELHKQKLPNVEQRVIPAPDNHDDFVGNHVPPVPLRRDILIIDGKIAVIDLPRKGAQSRNTDFRNSLIIRGEEAGYFETLFDKYWDGANMLTSDNIPEYD